MLQNLVIKQHENEKRDRKEKLRKNDLIPKSLNVNNRTSLWCLTKFYEGLKGLYKTFWGTTKMYENKNLS